MGISTSSRPRVGYWLNCEFSVLVNLMNAIEVLDQSWGVNSSSATFGVWFELEFPVTMTASRVIWILLFIDEVMIPNPWSAVGGHLPSTIWGGGPSHHHLCLTLTCQSNRVRVSTVILYERIAKMFTPQLWLNIRMARMSNKRKMGILHIHS